MEYIEEPESREPEYDIEIVKYIIKHVKKYLSNKQQNILHIIAKLTPNKKVFKIFENIPLEKYALEKDRNGNNVFDILKRKKLSSWLEKKVKDKLTNNMIFLNFDEEKVRSLEQKVHAIINEVKTKDEKIKAKEKLEKIIKEIELEEKLFTKPNLKEKIKQEKLDEIHQIKEKLLKETKNYCDPLYPIIGTLKKEETYKIIDKAYMKEDIKCNIKYILPEIQKINVIKNLSTINKNETVVFMIGDEFLVCSNESSGVLMEKDVKSLIDESLIKTAILNQIGERIKTKKEDLFEKIKNQDYEGAKKILINAGPELKLTKEEVYKLKQIPKLFPYVMEKIGIAKVDPKTFTKQIHSDTKMHGKIELKKISIKYQLN